MRYRKGGTRQKNAHAARLNVCAIVRAVYVLCTFCFLPLVLLVLRNSLICSHACFTLTFCSFTFCFIPRNIYTTFYPTVARRVVEKQVSLDLPVSQDGSYIIDFSPLDPAVVLEKIVVDYGGYKKSYLYMNESPCRRTR